MAVERLVRRLSSTRIVSLASGLLDRSTLCALSTITAPRRAHINTAYFAWDRATFDIVWLSAPEAQHSRNLRRDPSTAIAVFDSRQTWGRPDRGIQLLGVAREVGAGERRAAVALYRRRFSDYDESNLDTYRLYRFRPRRVKLFYERVLGGGVFVTARVYADGRTSWMRTERYR